MQLIGFFVNIFAILSHEKNEIFYMYILYLYIYIIQFIIKYNVEILTAALLQIILLTY